MPENEQNKNEFSESIVRDIAKEFNVIVDSVKNDKSDFVHDRYFRFANYPEYYRDIGYPFKVEFLDVGHAIDDVELKDFSPITLVALTAMKYIGAKAQYMAPRSYRQVHLPLRLSA